MEALRQFALRYLIADAVPLSVRERRISALAGCLGILLMQGILAVLPAGGNVSYLLAPLGASTVILFALPHSPLAQPWSLAGGLLLSALVGYMAGLWVQPAWLAIGVALGVAIWLTALLRCIHPPGGAMAVVFAIAAQQHTVSLLTALLNVVAGLIAVLAINNLMPGRRYPQCVPARPTTVRPPRRSIRHEDLQYALEKLDTYLDVSEDDLVSIYDLATAHAHRRHERRTCGEVMSSPALAVTFATELNEAWALMQEHHLHGLPVVDPARRVIGVLTLENYLRHVAPDNGQSIGENIRRLLRPTPTAYSDKPEVVGQIMSQRFITASLTAPLGDMLALLSSQDHPAIVPVVDEDRRLAGVLTQTDLLAAVYHRQAASAARH
ncbi:HPP family protein [Dechloromonas sp. XY25]|uniref:HPP family protein n=1 Tax=Dechloromonas hankyongensis TaxID=2908002 RepID=A0ABS9JY37_9RHOO|nr:HPP family protein [Dechloromonas hankyongensis]MCG2575796.1 HPP family protein [Dechloromonas hankyongensis]